MIHFTTAELIDVTFQSACAVQTSTRLVSIVMSASTARTHLTVVYARFMSVHNILSITTCSL